MRLLLTSVSSQHGEDGDGDPDYLSACHVSFQ
jgi:hypothetical protein